MGFDYALVHLRYTIPPAVALTLIYRPFLSRLDLYKIAWLSCFAVTAAIPWDAYQIYRGIWTYPPDAIVGPTLFGIPSEELFFFVIQTYTTSLLYLLLTKPVLHSAYITRDEVEKAKDPQTKWLVRPRVWATGQMIPGLLSLMGAVMVYDGGRGTYLGLILIWVGPIILLLWNLSYGFIVKLPLSQTLLSIGVPTVYLWLVDTLALQRGTWAIMPGTKFSLHLWPGLDIEEAIFFLSSNILIVFGMITFDNALAILDTFPKDFPCLPSIPSAMLLLRGLFLDPLNYDERRTAGIAQAVSRLKNKSRSFYLASATFEGRLRIDLILLYSFCRMADDLVDDAASIDEARSSVHKLRRFLDVAYSAEKGTEQSARLQELVKSEFPPNAQDALLLLPLEYLSAAPLYDLLRGFEMDLEFSSHDSGTRHKSWPIASEDDLELYSLRVAGTVAELCLDLVFHHASPDYSRSKRAELIQAGRNMGIALQLVNIARDVAVDAKLGRVYIPSIWLKDMELTPEDVLREPRDPKVEILQGSLLRKAEEIYREARSAIEQLPPNGRSGMRVAVESYMEIGRVLREKNYHVKSGRATVPKLRRIRVAWQALTRL